MGANTFGRRLGVGVRLASGMIRDRAAAAQASPASASQSAAQPAAAAASPVYRERGRALASGGRRLGTSLWRPFAHASGVLWLEVTGVFFALFASFFAQGAWRSRGSLRAGPEHQHFLLYTAVALLFAYFSASSFLRARHRKR